MKGGEKARLLVIRTILAAIKQIEVDERIELDNDRIIAVLDKMAKQRRESIEQFSKGSRDDLIAIEEAELLIIKEYLPEALSETEINALVEQSINSCGAASITTGPMCRPSSEAGPTLILPATSTAVATA